MAMVASWPIIGNVFDTLKDPSLVYLKWSKELDAEVFQMRIGNRIVVVANSFDSIKELWLKNSVANNSRPVLYTFHKVLSKGEVFTIGTTPFSNSYKKKRKQLSTYLHKKNVDCYSELISREATRLIGTLLEQPKGHDVSMLFPIQQFSLRISLQLTYGFEYNKITEELAKEIICVENKIVQMRSHTANIQDYVPLWRLTCLRRNSQAVDLRQRRNRYMEMLFQDAVSHRDRSCLVNGVMNNPSKDITLDELKSICLTMVSAGLDNIGLNVDHCLGQLSRSKELEEKAYQSVLRTFGTAENAWDHCLDDDLQCDYIVALIRETLRYFTVLPLSLPRATSKAIHYRGAVIPKGTILFMNAYAGNHDGTHFSQPFEFMPERYLNSEWILQDKYDSCNGRVSHGIPSFSFGVGSRMCIGNHLAFKQMYIVLIKLVVLFHISEPLDPQYKMELDPLKANRDPTSIAMEPRPFQVRLTVRDAHLLHHVAPTLA